MKIALNSIIILLLTATLHSSDIAAYDINIAVDDIAAFENTLLKPYDPFNVPTVKGFRIIYPYSGDRLSNLFPIIAYPCVIYGFDESRTPLYYQNDFYIQREGWMYPSLLGTTVGQGGGGSEECALYERDSILKGSLKPGTYFLFVVRKKEGRPEARTPVLNVFL